MHKMAIVILALAMSAMADPVQDARADGLTIVRPAKKVRAVYRPRTCNHDRCGLPSVCPDGMCYSLYGAYGPYGGAQYWSRYSYGGWGRW
jgi:hypothetical protein